MDDPGAVSVKLEIAPLRFGAAIEMVAGFKASSARILKVTTFPSFPCVVLEALSVSILGEISTGSFASMVIMFPPLRLLAVFVAANTKEAEFPARSVIVPPFRANAEVPV